MTPFTQGFALGAVIGGALVGMAVLLAIYVRMELAAKRQAELHRSCRRAQS